MKNIIVLLFLTVTCVYSNAEVNKVLARATAYHKTHSDADYHTKRQVSSTKIRLEDSRRNIIGMVAVDPEKISYGSLIYSPETDRFYLACDTGGDVKNRKAAILTAQAGSMANKYRKAIVLDFYAVGEILEDDFGHFLVVNHYSKANKSFEQLDEDSQELRLRPDFWLERVGQIYNSGNHSEFSDELRDIVERLNQMSRT